MKIRIMIYKITNLLNDKIYIGQTVKNDSKFRNYWGSGKAIKNAIRKYGTINFSKDILCICYSQKCADDTEIYFIKRYDSINNGYNISNGGSGSYMWSDLMKIKMLRNERMKGKIHSKETRNKISKSIKKTLYIKYKINGEHGPSYGTTLSDERKIKIGKSSKGRWRRYSQSKKNSIINKIKKSYEMRKMGI